MELSLSTDDQDRVIYLCILDTAFLGQIMRRKSNPLISLQKLDKKYSGPYLSFTMTTKKQPGADIIAEIESKIKRRRSKGGR